MRASPPAVAAVTLLALPVALAFFHGGYDADARLAGGIVAWLLAALAAVVAPLPRGRPAVFAIAGLALLLALTLASLVWAPLHAVAYGDAQRIALYLGALVAGVALLRAVPGLAVPALAAGAFAIVLAGLSERLLPWAVTLERSAAAGGRLAAPLGYWNAMGAVAAIGLVLCAGLAGDAARGVWVRALAAAGAPVLGAGLVLSFSRGGLLAAAAGLAVVLLARPSPAQLRGLVVVVAAAAVAGVVAALLPAVKDLEGARTAQGTALAFVIVASGLGAAAAQRALARREARGELGTRPVALPRPRLLAVAAALVVLAGVLVAAGSTRGAPEFGASAERLASVQSNRYAYWRVAIATWADHPLVGAGSGAFGVEWLRERKIAEGARDAHSLPLETAAELGLAGLLALGLLAGGVIGGAVRLQSVAPGAGAAAFGGLAAWGVHASLDWGWEMPSVSLIALLLAASILGVNGERARQA
jgi:O-antigen ligase/polysaccharide polymerase Wzy-like membrane protein